MSAFHARPIWPRISGLARSERAWEEFRHRSHFDRALIVVFFSQGSETAARFRQLAREQQEVEELVTGAIAAGASQEFLSRQDDDSSALGNLGSHLDERLPCGSRRRFEIGP